MRASVSRRAVTSHSSLVSMSWGSPCSQARAGMGVSYVPHSRASTTPLLPRVPAEPPAADREMWLVVHPDLRRAPRIRAVMDYLVALFQRDGRLLLGNATSRRGSALARRAA